MHITPHVAEKKRYRAIDQRTTCWSGYQVSMRQRKIVEEAFGWMKTVGGLKEARASRRHEGAGGVHLHLRLLQSGETEELRDGAVSGVRKKGETRSSGTANPRSGSQIWAVGLHFGVIATLASVM